MPEMISSPVPALVDEQFLAYAGGDILSKTLLSFCAIMLVAKLFDVVSDSATRPSKGHVAVRAALALLVPFTIICASTYAQTMPYEYRAYGDGTYEIGKSLPAGTYLLSAGPTGGTVKIEGQEGETDDKWASGYYGVTVYDGDRLTIGGCSATNHTADIAYDTTAARQCVAAGSAFLVGGSDLAPGSYEMVASDSGACYEVRDGFLEAGKPLSPTELDGVAYADIHFGDVLYLRNVTARLFSPAFSAKRPAADGEEQKEQGAKDDAKDGDKDGDAQTQGDGQQSADAKDATEATDGDAQTQGEQPEAPQQAEGADTATDTNGDGKTTVQDLIDRIDATTWTRGSYVPMPEKPEGGQQPEAPKSLTEMLSHAATDASV